MLHPHLDHGRESLQRTVASLATAATAAGGLDTVRVQVHAFAGLWGDLAGILISGGTVVFWMHKLYSWILARRGR